VVSSRLSAADRDCALRGVWCAMGPSDPNSSESVPADRFRDDRSVGFGRYRMFPALRLLLRDGDKIELGARAFDVLWTLLEAGGKVVSKDELIDKVWAGAIVEENNLQAQISAIRRPDRVESCLAMEGPSQ